MGNPVFDEIMKTQNPLPQVEGHIWLTILLKYDLNGNVSIVKSRAYPKSDSEIKDMFQKKKKPTAKIETTVETTDELLF